MTDERDPFRRPRVVGLDISLTGTGMADDLRWCTSVGRTGVTKLPLAEKMSVLYDLTGHICTRVVASGAPDLVVIEHPITGAVKGGSALERDMLWGFVVRDLMYEYDLDVIAIQNTKRQVYACGRPAGKEQVVEAVTRTYPEYATGGDNNQCDAVVLMAMGRALLGDPLARLPKTHSRALDGLCLA